MDTPESESINVGLLDQNPQIIFSWKAPLRAYKKTGKNVLRFYIALAFLLSLLVFFFGDKILLVPIWSLLFLFYVLTVTPPPEIDNKITRFGIDTAGITIRWEALSHFYFSERFGFKVLTLVSHSPYLFHSYLIVPTPDIKEKVMRILSEHILYQEEPEKTLTDKMIDWLSHLIPEDEEDLKLEDKHHHKTHHEGSSTINHTPLSSSFQIPEVPSL